ncbi:recombinase family protein [Curtobacterium sp. KT1]|uniref:recombinase family protein n=1 Tax=Curtobacterium sp. KT1 TaxID=3372858 RepID=UPI0037BFA568
MKAVTYRRSATENPTWLDDQEADCRRYAEEHGLTITNVVTDIGRSRDGLRQVIESAEQDGVTALIVTDLARLGTRLTDHIAVVQQLHDAGIDIHVAKEGPATSREELLFGVMQSYAEADDQTVGYPLGDDDSGD